LVNYVPDGGIMTIILPEAVNIESDPFGNFEAHPGLTGLEKHKWNNPFNK